MTTDCRCAGGGGEGLYAVGQWWRWGDSWEEDKGVVEVRMYVHTYMSNDMQPSTFAYSTYVWWSDHGTTYVHWQLLQEPFNANYIGKMGSVHTVPSVRW